MIRQGLSSLCNTSTDITYVGDSGDVVGFDVVSDMIPVALLAAHFTDS